MPTDKKTFNIGEYCKGGVITVEVERKKITVIGREWDFSKGSTRNSDQSQATEFTRATFIADEEDTERMLADFLCDLTTSYYAEQVTTWIESKVHIRKYFPW